MKVGTNELTFSPVRPAVGAPQVQVAQRAYGFTLGSVNMTCEQARQMAAEITLAADLAEGKTP